MKKKRLSVALTVVGLTMLLTAACLTGSSSQHRNNSRNSQETSTDRPFYNASMLMPNYSGMASNDVCSGQNLQNSNQLASYNCSGYPGSTCVSCVPGTNAPISAAGLGTNAGAGTYQPSGASDGSCSIYEIWLGQCQNPGGVYSCAPSIQFGSNCSGSYPYYEVQSQQSPVVLNPSSEGEIVEDPHLKERLIVIR